MPKPSLHGEPVPLCQQAQGLSARGQGATGLERAFGTGVGC